MMANERELRRIARWAIRDKIGSLSAMERGDTDALAQAALDLFDDMRSLASGGPKVETEILTDLWRLRCVEASVVSEGRAAGMTDDAIRERERARALKLAPDNGLWRALMKAALEEALALEGDALRSHGVMSRADMVVYACADWGDARPEDCKVVRDGDVLVVRHRPTGRTSRATWNLDGTLGWIYW